MQNYNLANRYSNISINFIFPNSNYYFFKFSFTAKVTLDTQDA